MQEQHPGMRFGFLVSYKCDQGWLLNWFIIYGLDQNFDFDLDKLYKTQLFGCLFDLKGAHSIICFCHFPLFLL